MKIYRKWILTLGIAAVTPGIAAADSAPFSKSEPKSAAKSADQDNQEIAQQVAGRLRAARLSGYDIEIEVKDGVCLLKGKIADASQKRQADQLASGVAGVNRIENRLTVLDEGDSNSTSAVQQAAGTREPSRVQQAYAEVPQNSKSEVTRTGFFSRKGPSDQDVANKVAQAIGQSGLRGHDMDLKVKSGVAIVSGTVRSPQDVAAVTQIVSRVPGIRQVENSLTVPGQRPAIQQVAGGGAGAGMPGVPSPSNNQGMAEMIAGAIGRSPLANEDIEVRFNNGVATLSGSVSHPQMSEMAEAIAGAGPGVQGVRNNLRVVAGAAGPQFNQQLGGGGPQFNQPMGGPPIQQVGYNQGGYGQGAGGMIPPMPAPPMQGHGGAGASHMAYDMPHLPEYAWPSYAAYPNSAAVSYPTEYSASAWPYIGPFHPYPQVPLGWRQVQMEWDDGYWSLNFRPRTDKWFWYFDPKNW